MQPDQQPDQQSAQQSDQQSDQQPAKTSVVDCATACVAGCILGDECPNLEYKEQASQFIQSTSLEKMLEIAESAIQRRRLERASEPPKWIIPDDF